ncbi:flagellar basal body-associated protein FliL [Mangrovibacillus cuniculi]|uniref:Flagellar protein FliL n=1 Tax=Mangrovibacillus cuniculi TaxID=2593652 RepID=A0A7S8CAD9_9BACI|nr:flagellar basal body-associated protein FliL [Mangrovibacillus cuniculi]QPC46352.1 flagellar basal body-associated protein FliL [Mangrovibacillus cuniculi]
MKNNKLMIIMLGMVGSILIVGTIFLVLILNSQKASGDEPKEPTIDEILEASVDVPEMTTNLQGNDFIRIAFKIQSDSKKAKEELEKRSFQVQNIIIEELSSKTAEDLSSAEGKQQLEDVIQTRTSELMQEGSVVRVYITSAVIQ